MASLVRKRRRSRAAPTRRWPARCSCGLHGAVCGPRAIGRQVKSVSAMFWVTVGPSCRQLPTPEQKGTVAPRLRTRRHLTARVHLRPTDRRQGLRSICSVMTRRLRTGLRARLLAWLSSESLRVASQRCIPATRHDNQVSEGGVLTVFDGKGTRFQFPHRVGSRWRTSPSSTSRMSSSPSSTGTSRRRVQRA